MENMEKEKKRATVENDSKLPEELLEQILSKLPCRSQSRFKCVSKSWNALLTSPVFVPPHLSDFIKRHPYDKCVLLRPNGSLFENHRLFSLSSNDSSAVDISFPISDMLKSSDFDISGHCNGILCLSVRCLSEGGWQSKRQIILYNPATRHFKSIRKSVMFRRILFTSAVGMGYDSVSDDYKVVRINKTDDYTYCVEEYSLNTDSWRTLDNSNINVSGYRFAVDALFFKGTYYWWASTRLKSSIILGLKMGGEVFRRVSMPPQFYTMVELGRGNLAVWKDSLSLIWCYDQCAPYFSRIEIWAMKEVGGGEVSWSKMRSMKGIPCTVKPLVFWKGNELLLHTFYYGGIKSYNVDTEEIEDIKVDGCLFPRSSAKAVNYVATLVSIKGARYLP